MLQLDIYLNVGRCKLSIKCCSNGFLIFVNLDGGVEKFGKVLNGLSQFTVFDNLLFSLEFGVLFLSFMYLKSMVIRLQKCFSFLCVLLNVQFHYFITNL